MPYEKYDDSDSDEFDIIRFDSFVFATDNKPFTDFMNGIFDIEFYKNYPIEFDDYEIKYYLCGKIDLDILFNHSVIKIKDSKKYDLGALRAFVDMIRGCNIDSTICNDDAYGKPNEVINEKRC